MTDRTWNIGVHVIEGIGIGLVYVALIIIGAWLRGL